MAAGNPGTGKIQRRDDTGHCKHLLHVSRCGLTSRRQCQEAELLQMVRHKSYIEEYMDILLCQGPYY